jgi:hypothetical protein
MKYIFIFCVALVITLTVPFLTRTVEIDLTEEIEVEEVEKTLDSEIDRLSIKYNVASSTIRSIIYCESRMYGSAVNYNRLKDGTIWSTDMHHFQINDYYHKDTMTKLGLDYYDQWDSLEYGFILFKNQGLTPWNASKGCWSKMI